MGAEEHANFYTENSNSVRNVHWLSLESFIFVNYCDAYFKIHGIANDTGKFEMEQKLYV